MYAIKTLSKSVKKSYIKLLKSLSQENANKLREILKNTPKGSESSHWKIKKIKGLWQLDVTQGKTAYRLAYDAYDRPNKVVLLHFAGDHNEVKRFWRSLKRRK